MRGVYKLGPVASVPDKESTLRKATRLEWGSTSPWTRTLSHTELQGRVLSDIYVHPPIMEFDSSFLLSRFRSENTGLMAICS